MNDHDDEIASEERGIYLMMLLAGLPIVVALLLEGREIGGGNTLMLLLVAAGVVGLVAGSRAMLAARLPRARLLTPSDRGGDIRLPPR